MPVQPSASKTTLLLQCQKPFDPDFDFEKEEVGEGARYGSAFHSVMEHAPLEKGSVWDPARFDKLVDGHCEAQFLPHNLRQELAEHLRGSLKVLQTWLAGKNPFGRRFDPKTLKRELGHAFSFRHTPEFQVGVRLIGQPTRDHVYEGLRKGEIAGTSDLENDELVLDYKTGQDDGSFALPRKHPQLRTLSLAPRKAPIVAIFHADRRGLPVIYAEEMTETIRVKHAKRVDRALRRIGDGRFKPGPWCGRCPARGACPTQTANLLQGAAALITDGTTALAKMPRAELVKKEDVGRLHHLFSELDRLKEAARPRIKEFVRAAAEAGDFVQRPDGKVLRIEKRTEERLSKAKIVDALGVKEAERLFCKLRAVGALETTESESVWARFPD